tara:strand:+ start:475 stop:1116 length:642 start_codon:yes stop_codon:yes gene_type:complete
MKDKKLLLWVIPFVNQLKPITDLEKKYATNLSNKRAEEYAFSRGHMRDVLSKIFGMRPLDIPLESLPGKPPILKEGLGNISMSHCKDALLIGWSIRKIGVDIERSDRQFNFRNISEKYFFNDEKKELKKLSEEKLRLSILNLWVLKEASIKWQEGSIIPDLSLWKINKNYTSAYHQSLNLSINTFCLKKNSWVLGVAYDSRGINYKDITLKFY